jgi:hypothetical protein
MAGPLEDRDYFARRAAEERAIASTCEDNAAALAHFRLADEYERRAAEIDRTGQDISAEQRIGERTRSL